MTESRSEEVRRIRESFVEWFGGVLQLLTQHSLTWLPPNDFNTAHYEAL